MATRYTLTEFCRFALDAGKLGLADDPVRLGALFREYADIERTPNIKNTVDLVRAFGIDIHAVSYLDTGGVNMAAKGFWHIHYASKDRPATQKFDILHELFEVVHKTVCAIQPEYQVLSEPQLSRHADRFAAAVLIPPSFFIRQVNSAGCDLVKLSG